MFQGLIFVLAASLLTNESPQSFFGECPDAYTGFCFHGTCRFLVSEWEASCLCPRGYMGNRCEYVDLLQVMTGDPRTFTIVALAVTFLVVLTVIGTACLGVYLYRIKRDGRLALLNNMDIQVTMTRYASKRYSKADIKQVDLNEVCATKGSLSPHKVRDSCLS